MQTKVSVYNTGHRHHFTFCRHCQVWHFRGCELSRNFSRCIAPMRSLPRGTEFDARATLDEDSAREEIHNI